MALSQKRQQQKKMKEQKLRQQRIKQQKSRDNLPAHLSPIEHCFVYSGLWENGVGSVLITRRTASGRLFIGNYLLDVWFLGLKDAFVREVDSASLEAHLSGVPTDICNARYAKALILGAIRYGESNGLRPN